MKNFKVLLISMVSLVVCFTSLGETLNRSGDPLISEIMEATDSLNAALEIRNYKIAKQALDMLFPLMKKEMKLAKKKAAELKKAGEKSSAKEVTEMLKRKTKIHDNLHAMVDESSAGLRVKAGSIKILVEEYVDLLDSGERLISSN